MSWLSRKVPAAERVTSANSSGTSTFTTTLPSSVPGLHFQASIVLCWTQEDTVSSGRSAPVEVRARAHMRRLAARITQRCTVLDCAQAADEVLLGLFVPVPLPGLPAADSWVRKVNLQASPEDVSQAKEHMAAQRHEHLRSYRARCQAKNVRALLADPGLAYAWFLAYGRGELSSETIGSLSKITGIVAQSGALPDAGPITHDSLAHTISLLLSRLTAIERKVLIEQLPTFLKLFNQEELADHLSDTTYDDDVQRDG